MSFDRNIEELKWTSRLHFQDFPRQSRRTRGIHRRFWPPFRWWWVCQASIPPPGRGLAVEPVVDPWVAPGDTGSTGSGAVANAALDALAGVTEIVLTSGGYCWFDVILGTKWTTDLVISSIKPPILRVTLTTPQTVWCLAWIWEFPDGSVEDDRKRQKDWGRGRWSNASTARRQCLSGTDSWNWWQSWSSFIKLIMAIMAYGFLLTVKGVYSISSYFIPVKFIMSFPM